MGDYENADDVEFWWTVNWKHCCALVEDIYEDPFDDSRLIVEMQNDWWAWRSSLDASSLTMNPTRPFIVVNAMELLDIPGEHYFNQKTRMLYYMPREDEDMRTAQVIAPKHDKVLVLRGNDVDDKVENITFEKLQLGHVAYNGPGEGGIENAQATLTEINQGVTHLTHGGVRLDMTDSITFRDNYFFGFGAVGLEVYNGAFHTEVVGNAFSDIGETAFEIGHDLHSDEIFPEGKGTSPAPPDPPPSQLNLINGYRKMWTSFHGGGSGTSMAGLRGPRYQNWVDQFAFSSTWRGDPDAAEKGKKNFVKYDFDDAYTISEIRLGFDPAMVSQEERMGFEVLLSNDYQFREGNYTVVATQLEPAENWAVYRPQDDTKYRYMMIRTLDATPLALSAVYAFTPDREPYTALQRCKDVRLENNYFRRVGETQYGGAGITYYYVENAQMLHNEVIDIPYSGFSIGWGWWREPTGSSDCTIAYNYVENSSLSIHDGGSYYMLGFHPNSSLHHNVAYNDVGGNGTYYLDMGTDYMTWGENVAMYNNKFLLANVEGEHNTLEMFYATDENTITSTAEKPENTLIAAADPPVEAKMIMDEAGLEDEYAHVRDWVNDEPIRLPQEEYRLERTYNFGTLSQTLVSSSQTAAQTVLDKNQFGDLPGQYPLAYKYKLQEALDEVSRSSMDNVIRGHKGQKIRLLMMEMDQEFQRSSLEDLITQSETLLSEAEAAQGDGLGSFPEDAVKIFSGKLESIKTRYAGGLDPATEYETLRELEGAYRDLAQTQRLADIRYITAPEAIGCEIDKENKSATLIFPYGTDLSQKRLLSLELTEGALPGLEDLNQELTQPLSLPIYNRECKQMEMWTVNASFGSGDDSWYNLSDTARSTLVREDGIYLAPRFQPHMEAPVETGETKTIVLEPCGLTEQVKLSFILAAGAKEGMDVRSDRSCYDRYELEIDGDTASLYSVKNGVKTLEKEGIELTALSQGKSSEFSFQMTPEGSRTRLEVLQDGVRILNTVLNAPRSEGYFGIHTETEGILVQDSKIEGERPAAGPFADVEADRWSAQAIGALRDKGIVSGVEGGRFEPERSITRDEFLKMLLQGFAVEPAQTSAYAFDDVQEGAWNAGYIYRAAELGIVKGISEQLFGSGQPVSRQDLAVMAARLMEALQLDLEAVREASFTDAQEIAPYARESVQQLADAGILAGDDGGEARPAAPASREEAASIIYQLLQTLGRI